MSVRLNMTRADAAQRIAKDKQKRAPCNYSSAMVQALELVYALEALGVISFEDNANAFVDTSPAEMTIKTTDPELLKTIEAATGVNHILDFLGKAWFVQQIDTGPGIKAVITLLSVVELKR